MARGFLFSYESSAAGIGIAAAVVVAATAAAAAAPAAVAAAAPNDDQQNDDPAAVAAAKAVIAHMGTSYEVLTVLSGLKPSYAVPGYRCIGNLTFSHWSPGFGPGSNPPG